MAPEDIQEGCQYVNERLPNYYRQVEMIVDAPARPGGKVVAWSTDGFLVKRDSGYGGKTHGKCGIATFAAWATRRLDVAEQSA